LRGEFEINTWMPSLCEFLYDFPAVN
jgi:hypothetical protein